ncbi:hypothetical protein BH09BAC4_BH09BAC4_48090 [soil metagenome]
MRGLTYGLRAAHRLVMACVEIRWTDFSPATADRLPLVQEEGLPWGKYNVANSSI